jgi:hypothetical protein
MDATIIRSEISTIVCGKTDPLARSSSRRGGRRSRGGGRRSRGDRRL